MHDMNFGTVTVHSYNDAPEDEAEPKMGLMVNDQLASENLSFQPTSIW